MPRAWRTTLIGVVLAWVGCSGVSADQPAAGAKLAAAGLQEDCRVMRAAYEALHPGLFRYNTREQLDANWESLRLQLGEDRTLAEVYVAFSQFLATLKCGHSYCNFFNQPKSVSDALFMGANRVPFHFRWLDGRMIVTRNRSSEPGLRAGVEVRSINGVTVKAIFERMMSVARADGGNDAKRARSIEVTGMDRYEAFDIFFPMFFPMSGSSIEVVIAAGGEGDSGEVSVSVGALTYEQRIEPMKELGAKVQGDESVWDWSVLSAGAACLRMPGWALFNSTWDWRIWLNARFDELVKEGTPNLVIDLRGNEGGLGCGDVIVARLIEKDLQSPRPRRAVRYRRVPESLGRYLDTWDDSFRDWSTETTPIATPRLVERGGQEYFRLTKFDDNSEGDVIVPVGPRYAGRVFVLVDASCSSATFEFAQTAKQSGLATVVGETTGGNQRGINGGAFFFLRLPNSKIEMDVPLIATFGEGDAPDAGIEPDLAVRPSVADIARGIDAEREYVRALIRDTQK